MNEMKSSLIETSGMYQEDHGIVHNTFYDRLLNKTIGMGLSFVSSKEFHR